ncbi:unnamed protein product, partial [Iphiclides podalirius]
MDTWFSVKGFTPIAHDPEAPFLPGEHHFLLEGRDEPHWRSHGKQIITGQIKGRRAQGTDSMGCRSEERDSRRLGPHAVEAPYGHDPRH